LEIGGGVKEYIQSYSDLPENGARPNGPGSHLERPKIRQKRKMLSVPPPLKGEKGRRSKEGAGYVHCHVGGKREETAVPTKYLQIGDFQLLTEGTRRKLS